MRLLSLLIGLMGVFATNTSSLTATRTRAVSFSPSATRTRIISPTTTATRTRAVSFSPSATRTRAVSFSPSATRTRAVSFSPSATRTRVISPTDTATATLTQTITATGSPGISLTSTNTGTITGSTTGTLTGTQTGTQSFTPTKVQIAAAPNPADTPNTTYIAIGSIGGCLILMTIVAIAILMNNRQKRQLHYAPTMMNVPIPQYENPVSSRVLFAPIQTRGLTSMTD